MADAFPIVLFAIAGVGIAGALIALLSSRGAWDEIGRGELSLNDERDAPPPPPTGAAASAAERDEEIRQLLRASNDRRLRRGEEPLDVEAELRRLTTPATPAIDDGLRIEVRSLVIARNERRARRGEEPLDVDAEVERQLRELSA